MKEIGYDREKAVAYAQRWAMGRNRAYYDFESIGGDCTNFASQCIYAGSGVMNFTPVMGWYYTSPSRRAPAWTGVEQLHQFLVTNGGAGPYAKEVPREAVRPGDILQLGTSSGEFYHSPVILGLRDGEIYVAAHTYDALWRPLSSYQYDRVRYLHILGVRE